MGQAFGDGPTRALAHLSVAESQSCQLRPRLWPRIFTCPISMIIIKIEPDHKVDGLGHMVLFINYISFQIFFNIVLRYVQSDSDIYSLNHKCLPPLLLQELLHVYLCSIFFSIRFLLPLVPFKSMLLVSVKMSTISEIKTLIEAINTLSNSLPVCPTRHKGG